MIRRRREPPPVWFWPLALAALLFVWFAGWRWWWPLF